MRRGFKIIIAILAMVVAVLAYGYGQTFALRVTSDEVASDQLPKGFSGTKIVFAADFHCGIFFGKSRTEGVVQKIGSLDPDIVVLGGDYIESDPRYADACFAPFRNLKPRLGIYAALGNRDYQNGAADTVRQAMKNAGITLLENSGVWIGANQPVDNSGYRMRLGGVADILRSNPNLEGVLGGAAAGDFAILATHNPSFGQIADPRVDLALAGHTHGGQVTLFGIRLLPWQWNWRYASGIYKTDGTSIIVTNGVGTRLLPIRLFAPPEINLITLR
jgi:predicted MPP superfamily phosphohydrolase